MLNPLRITLAANPHANGVENPTSKTYYPTVIPNECRRLNKAQQRRPSNGKSLHLL